MNNTDKHAYCIMAHDNWEQLQMLIGVLDDERNDIYKANIRSRGPVINEVASKYNGGGHKFASGCRNADYAVMEKLAKDLDEACLKYITEENN